ncbi:GNAT family N-acetyltransferase [Tenacibaculum amylolyticum]|uniref:GNAT family N-acetyltransferase n=1 Tax=Tenacibaculum amylolyticum TaxID=104269 RepID=UPI003895C99F
MFLESERLVIRGAKVSDAPFYFKMFNDPDWIEYVHDKGLRSVAETEVYLEDILKKNEKLNGLGFFTVIVKETEEPIGMSSALQRETMEYIDVGYGFLPKGRGKGYAKEATELIMEYVRNTFQQEKVCAFTMPKNQSSRKLLERLGFEYVGVKEVFKGEEDCVYEFTF